MTFKDALIKGVLVSFVIWLTLVTSCFFLTGCNIQVPKRVIVEGETKSAVVHTVELSLQLGGAFKIECQKKAEDLGLVEETPEYEEYVTTCVNLKAQDFIQTFINLINSQNGNSDEDSQLGI